MTTHRTITYRLRPGSKGRAHKLDQIAGACRWTWNKILADNAWWYQGHLAGIAPKPSVTFFSLGKSFTALRHRTPWLQTHSHKIVKHTLKYQSEAWARTFKGGGFPRYKSRHRSTPSFTIAEAIRLTTNGVLTIPTPDRRNPLNVTLHGANPYPDGTLVKVVCKKVCDKWYAMATYKVVIADRVDDGKALGVDMNCGQVATSEPAKYHVPNQSHLEAKQRRYQRKLARQRKGSQRREDTKRTLAKLSRHMSTRLRNWSHHVSRRLADTAHTICVEALPVQGMTRRAKGKGRKAKATLNRSILRTGWSRLRADLGYKAGNLVPVLAAYTSQTCSQCGHCEKDNRPTQSNFTCVDCGHTTNADINAAYNILASGIGASARGGGVEVERPVNREIGSARKGFSP